MRKAPAGVAAGQGPSFAWSGVVRLADSLSNPNKQVRRLFEALDNRGGVAGLLDNAAAARTELIAQTGAEDPSSVRLTVKENRKLSPEEVAELVAAYRAGAEQQALARRYGVHRETVDRHLRRAGVAKRSMTKMTGAVLDRARELYEQGWSGPQISRELGINVSTVYKALKRAGVEMRPPVA